MSPVARCKFVADGQLGCHRVIPIPFPLPEDCAGVVGEAVVLQKLLPFTERQQQGRRDRHLVRRVEQAEAVLLIRVVVRRARDHGVVVLQPGRRRIVVALAVLLEVGRKTNSVGDVGLQLGTNSPHPQMHHRWRYTSAADKLREDQCSLNSLEVEVQVDASKRPQVTFC